MGHGSKARTIAATPDSVVRDAFGAKVAGCVAAASIYRIKSKSKSKVSVMTGKWELSQECLEESGHALIAQTAYGKIYSSLLRNADGKFKDNLRGNERTTKDGSVPVVVKKLSEENGAGHEHVKEFMLEVEVKTTVKDLFPCGWWPFCS